MNNQAILIGAFSRYLFTPVVTPHIKYHRSAGFCANWGGARNMGSDMLQRSRREDHTLSWHISRF